MSSAPLEYKKRATLVNSIGHSIDSSITMDDQNQKFSPIKQLLLRVKEYLVGTATCDVNRIFVKTVSLIKHHSKRQKYNRPIDTGRSKVDSKKLPKRRETSRFYKNLWLPEGLSSDPNHFSTDNENVELITSDELWLNLARMKNNSATGPSKISVFQLKSFVRASVHHSELIASVLSLVLQTGQMPKHMLRGRVTLIPKIQNAKRIGDFRPITVYCVIARLFSRITNERILECVSSRVDAHQLAWRRGENALAQGILTAKTALGHAQKNARSAYVATLDVRKAYDSVSHASIYRALQEFKVPSHLARVAMNSIQNNTRWITCSDGRVYLKPKAGVAQGLAISQTLFCLVLDTLKLNYGEGYGVRKNLTGPVEEVLHGSSFCDDLLLIDESLDSMTEAVTENITKLKTANLEVNLEKCKVSGFTRLRNREKTFSKLNTNLSIGDSIVKCVETFNYLGVEIGTHRVKPDFRSTLRRKLIATVSMRRSIKARLAHIKQCVIPSMIYELTTHCTKSWWRKDSVDSINGSRLYEILDSEVVIAVKRVLGIAKNCDGSMKLMFVPVQSGGLGFPHFGDIICGARSRLIEQIKSKTVLHFQFQDRKLIEAHEVKLGTHNARNRVDRVHKSAVSEFQNLQNGASNWLVEGQGVKYASLFDRFLHGSNLKAAFRLRSGLLGLKGYDSTMCRLCHRARETLVHVCAMCESLKYKEVKTLRHNYVRDTVFSRLETAVRAKGAKATLWKERPYANNRIRPDLTILDTESNALNVVDIHINYGSVANRRRGAEGEVIGRRRETISRDRDAKTLKYQRWDQALKENDPNRQIRHNPMVVSMFGAFKESSSIQWSLSRLGIRGNLLMRHAANAALRVGASALCRLLDADVEVADFEEVRINQN